MDDQWLNFSFPDFSYAFLSVLLEGIPFLLLGTLLSGMIDQFLPARLMTRFLPRNAYLAILMSASLGIIFPMCECGIVPVIRRLMSKGLPISSAIAYMLAAPIVNPIVAFSTYAAFRGQGALEMTALRLGIGWLVAIIVGMAGGNLAVRYVIKTTILRQIIEGNESSHGGDMMGGMRFRLGQALRVAMRDFLDVTVYFVLGVAIASLFNTAINQSAILPLALNDWLATSSLMGLAFILSLCSTTDAFIAATFVAFPAASKLAFLVLGPMLDIKLLFLYSSIFTKRFVFGLSVALFLLIGLICIRLSFFLY